MVAGDGDDTVRRPQVCKGARVVTAGLKPGERIVVNGLQRIRPGVTVAPEPVPMAQKSELKKPATELAQR